MLKKLWNWIKKDRFVRAKHFEEFLEDAGFYRGFEFDISYMMFGFSGAKPEKKSKYRSIKEERKYFMDEINRLEMKINRMAEYLDIKEKCDDEKKYYIKKVKKVKKAKKSS